MNKTNSTGWEALDNALIWIATCCEDCWVTPVSRRKKFMIEREVVAIPHSPSPSWNQIEWKLKDIENNTNNIFYGDIVHHAKELVKRFREDGNTPPPNYLYVAEYKGGLKDPSICLDWVNNNEGGIPIIRMVIWADQIFVEIPKSQFILHWDRWVGHQFYVPNDKFIFDPFILIRDTLKEEEFHHQ